MEKNCHLQVRRVPLAFQGGLVVGSSVLILCWRSCVCRARWGSLCGASLPRVSLSRPVSHSLWLDPISWLKPKARKSEAASTRGASWRWRTQSTTTFWNWGRCWCEARRRSRWLGGQSFRGGGAWGLRAMPAPSCSCRGAVPAWCRGRPLSGTVAD